jgi:uncharacterized protein YdeI (YjbR/CyaY-like superfamily)
MNPNVDHYFSNGCGRCPHYQTPACKVHPWADLLIQLREYLLASDLTEEFKWSQPCYTLNGKNVVILTAFKNFACLAFFKGSLMNDPVTRLISPGMNSRHGRQLRWTKLAQINEDHSLIMQYLAEAIRIEKAGLQVPPSPPISDVPDELQTAFIEDPPFEQAFYALSSGRQRGYIIFFSQAKKSQTRLNRINKYRSQILSGLGMHDVYRSSQNKSLK